MTIILNGTTGVTFPDGTTQTDGIATPVPVADGGTGASTAANARTALGLAIGTDVLAPNGSGANLTALNASNISSGTLSNDRLGIVSVAKGGTGTATPSLVGGTNITISGTWPNQTVTAAGGGVTSLNGQTGAITNTNSNVIGSYALCINNGTNSSFGSTYAAAPPSSSGVRIANTISSNVCQGATQYVQGSSTGLSGTWRAMSNADASGLVLYVRVS